MDKWALGFFNSICDSMFKPVFDFVDWSDYVASAYASPFKHDSVVLISALFKKRCFRVSLNIQNRNVPLVLPLKHVYFNASFTSHRVTLSMSYQTAWLGMRTASGGTQNTSQLAWESEIPDLGNEAAPCTGNQ